MAVSSHVYPSSSWQSFEQPSPETLFPSSHFCPASLSTGKSRPSPHEVAQAPPSPGHTGSLRQKGLHLSPESWFLSSHCSEPSTIPLPQLVRVQGCPGVRPCQAFGSVGPGLSSWHVGEQPSPALALASS